MRRAPSSTGCSSFCRSTGSGDGRRVLVFSQFTAMLDLIVRSSTRRRAPRRAHRPDTPDRGRSRSRASRQGEVDVFLISLKAGGVGLNLTRADTVIHYDPWWNPAAKRRPPTARTASARPGRCSSTS